MHTYWLWLSQHPDLSDGEKNLLMKHFREPEAVFYADAAGCAPEIAALVAKAQGNRSLNPAQKTVADCAAAGIQIIAMDDARYPMRLRQIPDPPLVLYCRGTLPHVDALPVIGVVGTRKASAYGMSTARSMGYQIARCGGCVVSGLAAGIDVMAMEGALQADGTVIGVLGCGVEQVYPRANAGVFEETLKRGCILSEYPPGTPPLKWNFPRRNRIISGLSCAILVVEAPQRSGSLITAHAAAEQGRDVFVVPGNVDTPGFEGSYQLLREGAAPAGCGWDIMEEYRVRFPGIIRPDDSRVPPRMVPKQETRSVPERKKAPQKAPSDKKSIDKEPARNYSDVNDILPKLTADETAIVSALRSGPRQVDDVIAETGLTTGKMLAAMTMLELKGVLRRLPGKRIVLN